MRHEAYMKQRIAEEEAVIRTKVRAYDNIKLTSMIEEILQRLEIIEEKIDELIKKRG